MHANPTREELESRIRILENEAKQSLQKIAILQKSEAYLQAILNNTNLPIYLKDRDYRYIFVNRQYEKLAHVTLDEIRGKEGYDIFPSPVAEMFRLQDEEVRECKALVEFTETVPLPDGELTFITAKFPLYDDAGNLYALGGVCTDITDLKRSEEALKESEKKYRQIYDNLLDAYYEASIDGIILDISPSIENFSKYKQEDLIGKSLYQIYANPDERDGLVERIIRDGRVNEYELHLTDKDGAQLICSINTMLVKDDKGEPLKLVGVVRDISERKRVEKEKKQ